MIWLIILVAGTEGFSLDHANDHSRSNDGQFEQNQRPSSQTQQQQQHGQASYPLDIDDVYFSSNFLAKFINKKIAAFNVQVEKPAPDHCVDRYTAYFNNVESDDCPLLSAKIQSKIQDQPGSKEKVPAAGRHIRTIIFSRLNHLLGNVINIQISGFRCTLIKIEGDTGLSNDCAGFWKSRVIRGTLSIETTKPTTDDILRPPYSPNSYLRPEILLLLYLAKCIPPGPLDLSLENIQNFGECLLPDKYVMQRARNFEKHILEKIEATLFERENLCNIKPSVIQLLREMNDVGSSSWSVGYELVQFVKNHYTPVGYIVNFIEPVGQEINGRISQMLAKYTRMCENGITGHNYDFMNDDNVAFLEKVPIKTLTFFDTHCSCQFWATVEDDRRFFVKMIGNDAGRASQGFGELATYYIDRLINLNRSPVVASRRLYLEMNAEVKYVSDPQNGFRPLLSNKNAHFSNIRNHMTYDETKEQYYISIVVIPEVVKDFQKAKNVSGLDMIEIIMNRRSVKDTRKHSVQDVRDIVDIGVLDFLSHNIDRKGGSNWYRADLRIFPFDGGAAFWPLIKTPVCKILLHCPPLVCSEHLSRLDTSLCESDNLSFLHPAAGKARSCLFTRSTIHNIRSFRESGSTIGESLLRLLTSHHYVKDLHHTDKELEKLCKELDQRVEYLLDYVDSCYSDLGEAIFV